MFYSHPSGTMVCPTWTMAREESDDQGRPEATAMYGKTSIEFPRRVVCLTAETAEIAFLVGAGDRVVGVPGTARRPEAGREKGRVGGFTTFRLDKILALGPPLLPAFSDLPKGGVRDPVGAGVAGRCTKPHPGRAPL